VEEGMSDTQVLLSKIAALRQRLEQAQGLVRDAGSAAASLMPDRSPSPMPVEQLANQVSAGSKLQALLEGALRQLPENLGPADEPAVLPRRLTARAARLLRHGQDALTQLRELADEPALQAETDRLLLGPFRNDAEPLAVLYREGLGLMDTVLHTVQAFPETPSVQLRLCDGLEVILGVVGERLAALRTALRRRKQEEACVNALAELLVGIATGQALDTQPLLRLAECVLDSVHQDQPLRFIYHAADDPVRFVAGHGLTVAHVVARITRHESLWRSAPAEPVMAALVHDVGMLCVPGQILCHAGPLDDTQRRAVEVHAPLGAERLARAFPGASGLAEAAACHHERLDGTGYPAGLRETQIAPLVRLLSACDVYAALCAPRPHRPALDTRTAVTDTLLLAEQGALDRHQAELLLKLSFYPPGTLVELADGAVGLVVATHQGRRDLNTPGRPVVAVLTASRGESLPAPHHIDLAECDGRSILRCLPGPVRRRILGKWYPELV
jgi:HD-GYP domain-containing protein (c-di-GMP phosphodiesterase class II)